ncbi:MAG: hypothetical protein ACYTBZ_19135, partial [Planctomycetota bacterium]
CGWAPYVLKLMNGETEPFNCPSDENPIPIAPVIISQWGPAGTGYRIFDTVYPSVSLDGAYFKRFNETNADGAYYSEMENDVTRRPDDQDDHFNDAKIYYKPEHYKADTGQVWATKGGTGRFLTLHTWKGKKLQEIGGMTERYDHIILWGSYGMNLSAALQGAKPWHVLYADYHDWSAIMEPGLGIEAPPGIEGISMVNGSRVDDPEKVVAYRHNKRANVGFLDTHVERHTSATLRKPAMWHPERAPNWVPYFPGSEPRTR